jgi:transmembrane sensor
MNNMDNSSIEEIFRRYYEQKATAVEKARLFQWIQEQSHTEKLLQLINDMGLEHKPDTEIVIEPQKAKVIIEKILVKTRQKRPAVLRMKWWKYAAVAALFIMLAGGYWLFHDSVATPVSNARMSSSRPVEIRPGGNKAVLTLADGRKIVLDSIATGDIADQAHVKIIKTDDGQISYLNGAGSDEILFNTISTPIGGQYQIVLADGSKVWLNAASSLRYPANFAGKERTVELKGEGYFEIVHDATKPFRVEVNGTTVEVLGTHFNINAYSDEPQLTTTLLEGKVKIENRGSVRFLKPGQQGTVEGPGKIKVVNDADLEESIAWKNGKFIFNGNNIYSVMRQLSRWYDIHAQYEDKLRNEEFVGVVSIPRSENISAILNVLQKMQVFRFKVNGRTVTVSPY